MLVFIHINKTGGRTVRYILRSSYGLGHCEVEPWHAQWEGPPFSAQDMHRLYRYYPHLKSIAGHRLRGCIDLEENGTKFRYFTIMRDPLKTCASHFQYNVQYRKKVGLVFEEWIQKEWPRNRQTKMIAGEDDAAKAIWIIQAKNIFVGLTGRFDESMVLLKELIADDLNISYKPINVAPKNDLAADLLADESTRALLVEGNREDLALYDFVQKELYPSYQQAYGPSLARDVADYQQSRSNGFNSRNLTLSRLKQYAFYKPLLYLYRRGVPVA